MKCINPTKHTTKGRIFLSTFTTEPLRGLPSSLLLVIIILPFPTAQPVLCCRLGLHIPPLTFSTKGYAALVTGIGRALIPGQHDHLHYLGQPLPCHWHNIGSADVTAMMALHWDESSSLQLSPCLVACCTQAYHVFPLYLHFPFRRQESVFHQETMNILGS